MWVIVVSESLSSYRDNNLNNLLNGEISNVDKEQYLMHRFNRYSSTMSYAFAKIFKTKSGAERLIKRFNKDDSKDRYSNSFNIIKNKHLSCRKLTIAEWNSIIDKDMEILKNKYDRSMSKIILKRNEYKY